ncbi:DUF3373 family protein [Sulfurimonas sp.]|uniref:DUF3373 family protein n=1 Tax=Sulfurimonas sp. TaxID=2022749 RepID=UPI003561C8F0
MTKKIFLLALMVTLSYGSSDLEKKLELLEAEVRELKKLSNDNKADLNEYIPIIEASETQSLLDKVDFLPELEVRMDKMDYELGQIEGENTQALYPDGVHQRRDQFSKDFDPAVAVKFKLNMIGNIDKYTKFNGRFIFTTSTQSNQRLCILSRDIKSVSASSAFDVDRAYVDYTPNIGSDYAFTFSFGVLPTTGGTPMNFALNNERKSMFPALVFDMNTYGLIGTQKLGEGNFLRFIAAKAYTLKAEFYPYQCNRENIDNANVLGTYFDTEFKLFGGDSLLSFGVNYLGDFKAHPYLGPDVNSDDASDLGDIFTYGLGIDIRNLLDDRLTFFAHSAISNPNANGKIDDYQIVDANNDGIQDDPNDPGFSMASYAKGPMIDTSGHSVYVGMKYDFNSDFSFGAEYNHGSKYWFSATQGAEDMYNKLAIRGDVSEGYAIYNFHKDMYVKLGYMYSNEDYTGSGWHFGEPVKKDGKQKISYLSIKAEF